MQGSFPPSPTPNYGPIPVLAKSIKWPIQRNSDIKCTFRAVSHSARAWLALLASPTCKHGHPLVCITLANQSQLEAFACNLRTLSAMDEHQMQKKTPLLQKPGPVQYDDVALVPTYKHAYTNP